MSRKKTPTLQVEPRQRTGSRYARRLRKAGKLPAVIYGHGQGPAHVAVDAEQIVQMLHLGNHLLNIDSGVDPVQTCLVKEVQYDYLGDSITHVDLVRVDLSETVRVMAPFEYINEDNCPGLKHAGAYLEKVLAELAVDCRADQIPESITVDLRHLDLEQTITVGDLTLPPGTTAHQAAETAVVSVHMSRAAEEEEPAGAEAAVEEGAEAAEPQVIGKGKEEESASEG